MADDYFLDQFTDQIDKKVAWKWFRKGLVLNATKKRDEQEFRNRFYPSGMSWNNCPMEYVRDAAKPRFFKISAEGEEKKEFGSANHEVIQKALHSTRYYYGDPAYPQFIIDEMERKFKERPSSIRGLPEVYCYCPEWLTSGWLDFPARESGKLVIADFKFTNVPIKEWLAKSIKLPTIEQETQLYVYAAHVNKFNYWDQKVNGLRLVVKNRLVVPELLKDTPYADLDGEYEWFSEVDEHKMNVTISMLDNIGEHGHLLIAGKFVEECNWEYCKKHINLGEL